MSVPVNQHINTYLDQFLSSPPDFAVLISGDWGSGKTYLVQRYLSQSRRHLYVSLNGTSKPSDITDRLYFAAFPVIADKTMRAFGSIARTIAGIFRVKSDLSAKDLLSIDSYDILVFDDLERSSISASELLGFINTFVEHDTKHVILIGNEVELDKKDGYKEIREKVIGFSLTVEPDFSSALCQRYSVLHTDYRDFLQANHEALLSIIAEGGQRNIRIAKNIVGEFTDIFQQCKSEGIAFEEFSAMFASFYVLSYAYKIGAIARSDIRGRSDNDFTAAFLKHADSYVPGPLEELDNRHPNVGIFSTAFDNEYLESKICDGFHDSVKLGRTLGDLLGRSNPKENPEWRNLWYLLQQSDEVIEESYNRMMDRFGRRDYHDAGEIFHVFGLLFRMREVGILKLTKAEITRNCVKFVNDKVEDRSLPLLGDDFSDLRYGSAHGLGFTSLQEKGFQSATTFYKTQSNKLRSKLLLEELNLIFEADQFDVDQFRSIILQGDRDFNVYGRPFLHQTDPGTLAEAIMRQGANTQFNIIAALGSRYEQSPYPDVSNKEARWLRSLMSKLKKLSKEVSTSTAFRIDQTLKWNIEKPSQSDRREKLKDNI